MLVKNQAAIDAADVLDAYWTGTLPVDPEQIAHAMGIRVEHRHLDPTITGILQVSGERAPQIFVQATDAPARRRFTIAHEIGHYYQHTTRGRTRFTIIDRPAVAGDIHEYHAEKFAVALLTPTPPDPPSRSTPAKGARLVRLLRRHWSVTDTTHPDPKAQAQALTARQDAARQDPLTALAHATGVLHVDGQTVR